LPYLYFRTLAVSADGKHIADLIEDKSVMEKGKWAYPLFVRTREVATGKELGRVRLDHRLGLGDESSAVVSRDGRVMVVTHTDGNTFAYDTATGKRRCRLAASELPYAVSADGSLAVSVTSPPEGGPLGQYRVWDTSTGQVIADVVAVLLANTAMAFSMCNRYMIIWRGLPGETTVFDLRYRRLSVQAEHSQLAARFERPCTAFFPDGKSVLTLPGIRGAERVSLEPLAWKIAPPPKPSESRLKRLWSQLGEPAALDAVFELARHSSEVVPFLKAKLLTEPPDPKAVAAHIGRLGSRLYAEREESTKALRAFGPAVLPALRAALKASPSLEARTRLAKLIAGRADTATPFTLARLRAVETLERCATPDAVAALNAVAKTATGTPWGDDAARSLTRVRNK